MYLLLFYLNAIRIRFLKLVLCSSLCATPHRNMHIKNVPNIFENPPLPYFLVDILKHKIVHICLNVSSVFQVRVINATINRSFSQLTEVYVNCNLVKSNINQIVVKLISSYIYIYLGRVPRP